MAKSLHSADCRQPVDNVLQTALLLSHVVYIAIIKKFVKPLFASEVNHRAQPKETHQGFLYFCNGALLHGEISMSIASALKRA